MLFAALILSAAADPGRLDSYPALLAHVRAGGTATLFVGVPEAGPGPRYGCAALKGFPAGVYDCFPEAGEAKMRARVAPTSMPAAQPDPFPGLVWLSHPPGTAAGGVCYGYR